MVSAQQHINQESYTSWRQRSELDKMADLPKPLEDELIRLEEQFWISGGKLKEIVAKFCEELDDGLSRKGSNIPMNLTWVHSLPTGKETGTVLTLDLGGTNLRVCKVELHGAKESNEERSSLDQEQYRLPKELKTGDADQLWAFIADKVEAFMQDRNLLKEYSRDKPMPLGFTFSYPATQDRIDHAVLQTWTKGFDIKGVEGQDVAQQLCSKLEEKKLPLQLICVINDTVGAMIASAYNDPATIIGAIFGTGCNAAYMASLSDIKKLDPNDERITSVRLEDGSQPRRMAINCEYGAFDNAHAVLPRTKYDLQIDAASPRPGEQAFEKLSAGLYLGEIFRLILLDLTEQGLIFTSTTTTLTTTPTDSNNNAKKENHKSRTSPLQTPYTIDTAFLSALEDDTSPSFRTTRDLFTTHLSLLAPTDTEIQLARHLAELIAIRGARLCACGVAALCVKQGMQTGHVAADGSVANKHPKFKHRWADGLGEILGWGEGGEEEAAAAAAAAARETHPIQMTSAEDGSAVGCAIIAVMQMQIQKRT